MNDIKAHISTARYQTILSNGRHEIVADEPPELGGTDVGFSPNELLCSALAACTCITLSMYADRKAWPLTDVTAHITLERNKETNTTQINRQISLIGDLTDEQKTRLLTIANQCTIHKILTNLIVIETKI